MQFCGEFYIFSNKSSLALVKNAADASSLHANELARGFLHIYLTQTILTTDRQQKKKTLGDKVMVT